MPLFYLLISIFTSSISYGQNVLIRAPGASPISYELALKASPHNLSLISYEQRRLQEQPEQERKLFTLADTLATHPELAVVHLKGLQSESPWTLNSLRFVRDLTEKILNIPELKERKDLKGLYCKTAVLLNDGPLLINCPKQFISLENLRRQFPKAEKIAIESLAFSLYEAGQPQIAAQTSYHWSFLSNTGGRVSFFGTYEQLFRQSLTFNDYISGSCDGFTSQVEEISLRLQATVFFSEECAKKIIQADDERTRWYQKKTTWWTATGVVVLGGIIYALKDKSISVSVGALKF